MISRAYIDAHCHLADELFSKDLESILDASEKVGVTAWIQGGIDPEDWKKQRKIAKLRPGQIFLAYGLHPWWIATQRESEVVSALKRLEKELPTAHLIGELGLDYLPRFQETKKLQQEAFRLQLLLNENCQKPLVLHIVQAHAEAIQTLKSFPNQKGLVHAFSEGKEVLKKYLDLGHLISVGGAITRAGYHKLKDALKYIPKECLVLETDAPDQTPELPGLTRESRNEPKYLIEIARAVAEIRKNETAEELLKSSSHNLSALLAS